MRSVVEEKSELGGTRRRLAKVGVNLDGEETSPYKDKGSLKEKSFLKKDKAGT